MGMSFSDRFLHTKSSTAFPSIHTLHVHLSTPNALACYSCHFEGRCTAWTCTAHHCEHPWLVRERKPLLNTVNLTCLPQVVVFINILKPTSISLCKSTLKTFPSTGSDSQVLGALNPPSITLSNQVRLFACTLSSVCSPCFIFPCFVEVSEVLSSDPIPRCNQHNNNNNGVDGTHFQLVVTD